MEVKDIKKYLNKKVIYGGNKYIFRSGLIGLNEYGYYHSAVLVDTNSSSCITARLCDVKVENDE